MNTPETKRLTGKVALVTGSSKGIGRAIAVHYGQLGASVVVNFSKDKAPADEVVQTIKGAGGNAVPVQADVSAMDGINQLFATALATFSKLDIVVANAGVEKVNVAVVEVTEGDFDHLFRINTKGPFLSCRPRPVMSKMEAELSTFRRARP